MESRRFDFREVGNVLFCRCVDRKLIDATVCLEWGDDLHALVDRENRSRIVIEFDSVEFLASSFLQKLIILERKLTAKKGGLVLQGVPPSIYEVFMITRLTQLFRITRSDGESLALFA